MITAPASLTKLVTALLTLSKCSDLTTKITCSEEAIESILGTGSSVAGLYEGETITLEMLLYCLLLPSANDAAAVLAYHFGNGSEEAFVSEMNEYVKTLGCENTHFANPHGLDDESVKGYDSDTQNRTTAWDMYLIAKEVLKNDTLVKMTSKYGKTMPATNKSDIRYLYNTNALLNSYSYYYYEDAVGVKTGTTDKAFLMCRYMLRWAFSNMQMKVLADKTHNMGEVAVEYGRGCDYVALVPSQSVTAVVLNDISIDDMQLVFEENFPKSVKAPVTAGQEIGKAKLMYGDIVVSEMTLVAAQDVKKNHIWAMFSAIEKVVGSKYFIIAAAVIIFVIIVLLNITKKKRRANKRRKASVNVVNNFSTLSKK